MLCNKLMAFTVDVESNDIRYNVSKTPCKFLSLSIKCILKDKKIARSIQDAISHMIIDLHSLDSLSE